MLNRRDREKFERLSLRHLDTAFNLALWIMKNPEEAEDVVQTAYMKAFENFLRFEGDNFGPWLLTIVRNTAFNVLRKRRTSNLISFDEKLHSVESTQSNEDSVFHIGPDEFINFSTISTQTQKAIQQLPTEYREVLFLREIEGYSYNEISDITEVNVGTVMSRLSRARSQLKKHYLKYSQQEQKGEL